MSYDEMELDTIGDRKTALFVIISDTDDTFNFVVAIMYSQLFNLLCDKADDVYNGRLPVHVRCLLDEFANIGQIPKFDKLIATIRSREISASIILQSQSQLKTIYKDAADTITGNCDCTLFLGGKEKSTLKEISEVLGKETIDLYNTSETRSNNNSYGLNYQKTGKDVHTDLVDFGGELFLLRVVHNDDVAVDQHLPCIRTEVLRADHLHLLCNRPFFLWCQPNLLLNVSCSSYHAAPSVVKIRRVWDYPNKQKSDVKGRVPLTDFSPVGTHRICLLISQNRIPRRFLREMSLHFTTDTIRAFVEYRISKKSKNHWISHVKATVSDTSISSGSISGAEHLLIAIRG